MKHRTPPFGAEGSAETTTMSVVTCIDQRKDNTVPCQFQCQPPFWFHGKPCPWCADRYEEAMDESYVAYQEEKASIAFERILPATDREWRNRLDQVAPVVITVDPFTFTYFASPERTIDNAKP